VLAFPLCTLLSHNNHTANKTDEVTDEDQDEGFQDIPSGYTNIAFDHAHDNLKEVGVS
jgi:hypothetical protein